MTKPKSTLKMETSVENLEQSSLTKLPWQKPRVQKLRISLDTASFPGSGGDAFGRSSAG